MASTNFTNNVTLTDADWFDDVDTKAYSYLTGVAGTNTITANGPASLEAYAAGLEFEFIPANTNTGATTINITGASALGARNIFSNGAACVGGELRQNVPVKIFDDGTRFHILSNAVPVPFVDTYPVVVGSADSTKKVRLEVDGLTTATTRVVTVPDSDFTIATAGANSNITSLTGLTTALTVAQGGQGNALLTPYAVLCGGTTSTGACQSIAGVGTSGQVLTSNGAGALPTFQSAAGSTSKVVTFTYNTSTASGTQAITGAGFTPSGFVVFGSPLSTDNRYTHGFAGSDKGGYSFLHDATNASLSANVAIFAGDDTTTNFAKATVSTWDSDGCTLSWVKTGSPTLTFTFDLIFFK